MRLLCELLIIGALIWLGWSKSFQSWTYQLRGTPEPPPRAVPVAAAAAGAAPRQPFIPRSTRPAPTPGGDWMWDPAHRSTLDRPAFDSQKESKSYKDSDRGSYWIDSHGVRHSYNATPAP